MSILWFVIPVALIEAAVFYALHWAHRELLPARFRTLLLSKGVLKSAVYVGISLGLTLVSAPAGWVYAIGHPVLGAIVHIRWCRANDVDPLRVRPRERYVAATADWVTRLEAFEAARRNQP